MKLDDFLEMLMNARASYQELNNTYFKFQYGHFVDKVIRLKASIQMGYHDCYSIWLFDVHGNLLQVGHYREDT